MKTDYVKKGLAVGIILLFIGAGVYPAIAVKLNTSLTNTIDKVENKDISINDISNFNFDRLNLLMFFSMKPKLFTPILKSYSKISNDLCKLSSKDCLKIVNKMVKEKLTMTLKALEIIKSKSLIDSSKTKIDYEDIYLKISEISSKYDESSFTSETQERLICKYLGIIGNILEDVLSNIADIRDNTKSIFVFMVCMSIIVPLVIIAIYNMMLMMKLDCIPHPSP